MQGRVGGDDGTSRANACGGGCTRKALRTPAPLGLAARADADRSVFLPRTDSAESVLLKRPARRILGRKSSRPISGCSTALEAEPRGCVMEAVRETSSGGVRLEKRLPARMVRGRRSEPDDGADRRAVQGQVVVDAVLFAIEDEHAPAELEIDVLADAVADAQVGVQRQLVRLGETEAADAEAGRNRPVLGELAGDAGADHEIEPLRIDVDADRAGTDLRVERRGAHADVDVPVAGTAVVGIPRRGFEADAEFARKAFELHRGRSAGRGAGVRVLVEVAAVEVEHPRRTADFEAGVRRNADVREEAGVVRDVERRTCARTAAGHACGRSAADAAGQGILVAAAAAEPAAARTGSDRRDGRIGVAGHREPEVGRQREFPIPGFDGTLGVGDGIRGLREGARGQHERGERNKHETLRHGTFPSTSARLPGRGDACGRNRPPAAATSAAIHEGYGAPPASFSQPTTTTPHPMRPMPPPWPNGRGRPCYDSRTSASDGSSHDEPRNLRTDLPLRGAVRAVPCHVSPCGRAGRTGFAAERRRRAGFRLHRCGGQGRPPVGLNFMRLLESDMD
jgi:hypothetical protein